MLAELRIGKEIKIIDGIARAALIKSFQTGGRNILVDFFGVASFCLLEGLVIIDSFGVVGQWISISRRLF